MKALSFCFSLLFFSTILLAQDTLFMKNGITIPVEIIEKGEVELKYKKITPPASVAIYSVFISDIASIHYKNGAVIDYSKYDPDSNKKQENESLKAAGSVSAMRFTFGLIGNYGNRNENDNLRLFWRHINNDNSLEMAGNKISYAFNLGFGTALDGNKRNWFGGAAQLLFTPSDAIHVTNYYYGSNEIKLKMFYINIMFYYGHTLNHKKNLLLMFDPGIEMGNMSGFIKINDIKYKVSGSSKISAHLAAGFDWIISKRVLASLRVGQRFMKVEESHKSSASKTGYASFYVAPPSNLDLVNVNWSGTYINFGLSVALYKILK